MPRQKFAIGERVVGNEKKAAFRGRKGTVIKWQKAGEYQIHFDDGAIE